LDEIREKIKTH
jgi:hypothetical protein